MMTFELRKKYSDIGSHFVKIIVKCMMVQTELKLDAWLGRKLDLKYETQTIHRRATACQPANLLVLSHTFI